MNQKRINLIEELIDTLEKYKLLFKETEEEYVKASDLKPGDKIIFHDMVSTVLDNDYQGGVFCLADGFIGKSCFHDKDEEGMNNWAKSSLRAYLNENYYDCLSDIEKESLSFFDRDLTSEDGLTDYGTCEDVISLISCNEYRKYKKYIDKKEDWWWTLTATSTPDSSNSRHARFVSTDGSLIGNTAFDGHYGVSPAYVLLSSSKVRRA